MSEFALITSESEQNILSGGEYLIILRSITFVDGEQFGDVSYGVVPANMMGMVSGMRCRYPIRLWLCNKKISCEYRVHEMHKLKVFLIFLALGKTIM